MYQKKKTRPRKHPFFIPAQSDPPHIKIWRKILTARRAVNWTPCILATYLECSTDHATRLLRGVSQPSRDKVRILQLKLELERLKRRPTTPQELCERYRVRHYYYSPTRDRYAIKIKDQFRFYHWRNGGYEYAGQLKRKPKHYGPRQHLASRDPLFDSPKTITF